MVAVVRIRDYRRKPQFLHFTRAELNLLLGLYATRVSRGEWRDYAINSGTDAARFMVFRRSQENPLFTFSKISLRKGHSKLARQNQYIVSSQQKTISQGHSLSEVLTVFNRSMKLVTG
ncbi:MAG TPA: DUF2794 domain-containing protein [Rhodospirillaceae bacterium]|nr:hypothetical protein [Candidatus Neomarinimicrobiota bacterium]HCX14747.1 DUF2794 domain-containing protein [Rhodospirillaceae bacterium]